MPQTILLPLLTAVLVCSLHADPHLGPVTDIEISGTRIFSVSQAGIVEGVGEAAKLKHQPAFRVTSLCNDPTGKSVFFAGGDPGRSGFLGGGPLAALGENGGREIAKDLLYDIALSPHNTLMVVAGADGKVRILDRKNLATPERVVHEHTAAARAVAFSPDGKWLASVGLDGVILLSEVAGASPRAPRQLLDHTAAIECLIFSPDSRFLASGSRDSKVRLHRVDGKLIRTYSGIGMNNEPVAGRVPARVLSLAWNQSSLLAGTSKGTLHKLSLEDDMVAPMDRPSAEPIYTLVFASDGTLLVGTQSRIETHPSP